ncbi:MAG: hypothetical protein OXQ30_13675 [Boseongicola sp.]|nr:hypothetical protein [Boseongicola sp.]
MSAPAFAVGTESDPPKPSETTTQCTDGEVWDANTESCVPPEESTEDQAAIFQDARELAWFGDADEAVRVLDTLPTDDLVLTYRGFLARLSGDWLAAESYYQAALKMNPDNILARSYYGQGLAEIGEIALAEAQLSEIRRRGGRQTWAELALRLTLSRAEPAY